MANKIIEYLQPSNSIKSSSEWNHKHHQMHNLGKAKIQLFFLLRFLEFFCVLFHHLLALACFILNGVWNQELDCKCFKNEEEKPNLLRRVLRTRGHFGNGKK